MLSSNELGEIAQALSKAQGAFELASKDSTNPHFRSRYADLTSVWNVARKPLADNDLFVSQTTRIEGGLVVLVTRAIHKSGQWIASEYPIKPVQDTPQGLGSSLTYGKRYSLTGLLGIVADELDDDAELASQKVKFPHGQPEKKLAAGGVKPPTARSDSDKQNDRPPVAPVIQEKPANVTEEMSFSANPWDAEIKIKFSGADLTGKKLRDLPANDIARVYKALQSINKPGVQHKHLMDQIEKCLSGHPKEDPK